MSWWAFGLQKMWTYWNVEQLVCEEGVCSMKLAKLGEYSRTCKTSMFPDGPHHMSTINRIYVIQLCKLCVIKLYCWWQIHCNYMGKKEEGWGKNIHTVLIVWFVSSFNNVPIMKCAGSSGWKARRFHSWRSEMRVLQQVFLCSFITLRQMKRGVGTYTGNQQSVTWHTVISILLHCLVYWQYKNCTCDTLHFVGSFV